MTGAAIVWRGLLGVLWLCAGLIAAHADPDWPDTRIAEMLKKAHGYDKAPAVEHTVAMDATLTAVFSRAPNGRLAFDFVSKPNARIVRFSDTARRADSISFGGSWGLRLAEFVNGASTGKSRKLSVIFGYVPFPDFSEIEISWNCKQPESKLLGPNGHFVFWRFAHGWKRCNTMYLFNTAGERFLISRDADTGDWVPVKTD